MTAEPPTAAPVVASEQVSHRFQAGAVLRGISLQVQVGEHVALLGPNGAGKTTLLRILATLLRPTSGQVRLFGLDPAASSMAIRRRIGVVAHHTMLYPELTSRENLRYYAGLYDLDDPEPRVQAALAEVGLAAKANALVRSFSRGMQQRLSLGRALLHEPELLLLDEPDAGLDARALDLLPHTLARAGERGAPPAIVFTTHQIGHAAELARRVVVIVAGRLVFDGDIRSLDSGRLAALYGAGPGGN